MQHVPHLLRSVRRLLSLEATSGVLLLAAAALALGWANSSWAHGYAAFWHSGLRVRVAGSAFEPSLEWLVDDALMAIFFFVVGLEIRLETHRGELSEWRRAALPAAAALGGMIAPALLYSALATTPSTRAGWGVPMATDIAFAVAVLTLLGRRVPPALRVLLLALAVIDDLGAIVVVALFYASGLHVMGFVVAALGLVSVIVLQRAGVQNKLAYGVPALVVWSGTLAAGVHPTIAGVILGLITPVRASLGQTRSPAESLIADLHPWVAFGIMPLFALANAGVSLDGLTLDEPSLRVACGVTLGLVLGKPLGVLLAIGLVTRTGLGTLPPGLSARHLSVLGAVAGVGFTMALFIAQLAFSDPKLLAAAKLGVLCASGVAALGAWLLGRSLLGLESTPGAANAELGPAGRA